MFLFEISFSSSRLRFSFTLSSKLSEYFLSRFSFFLNEWAIDVAESKIKIKWFMYKEVFYASLIKAVDLRLLCFTRHYSSLSEILCYSLIEHQSLRNSNITSLTAVASYLNFNPYLDQDCCLTLPHMFLHLLFSVRYFGNDAMDWSYSQFLSDSDVQSCSNDWTHFSGDYGYDCDLE